jgi:hypothetical protein
MMFQLLLDFWYSCQWGGALARVMKTKKKIREAPAGQEEEEVRKKERGVVSPRKKKRLK